MQYALQQHMINIILYLVHANADIYVWNGTFRFIFCFAKTTPSINFVWINDKIVEQAIKVLNWILPLKGWKKLFQIMQSKKYIIPCCSFGGKSNCLDTKANFNSHGDTERTKHRFCSYQQNRSKRGGLIATKTVTGASKSAPFEVHRL